MKITSPRNKAPLIPQEQYRSGSTTPLSKPIPSILWTRTQDDQNRLRNPTLSVVRYISVIHNCDETPPAPPGDSSVADVRVAKREEPKRKSKSAKYCRKKPSARLSGEVSEYKQTVEWGSVTWPLCASRVWRHTASSSRPPAQQCRRQWLLLVSTLPSLSCVAARHDFPPVRLRVWRNFRGPADPQFCVTVSLCRSSSALRCRPCWPCCSSYRIMLWSGYAQYYKRWVHRWQWRQPWAL